MLTLEVFFYVLVGCVLFWGVASFFYLISTVREMEKDIPVYQANLSKELTVKFEGILRDIRDIKTQLPYQNKECASTENVERDITSIRECIHRLELDLMNSIKNKREKKDG